MDLINSFLVQHFLERSTQRFPDKIALIFGDERLTYREIDEKANQMATFLRSMGIERQDRVAIFLDNSVESIISLFGILKADAIFLMLSPTLKPPKLTYILKDCQVKALITHKNKAGTVSEAIDRADSVHQVVWVGPNVPIPTTHSKTVTHHSFSEILLSAPNGIYSSLPSALPPAPYTLHPTPYTLQEH